MVIIKDINMTLLNYLWPVIPFYISLKMPENLRFSGVFRRYRMVTSARYE